MRPDRGLHSNINPDSEDDHGEHEAHRQEPKRTNTAARRGESSLHLPLVGLFRFPVPFVPFVALLFVLHVDFQNLGELPGKTATLSMGNRDYRPTPRWEPRPESFAPGFCDGLVTVTTRSELRL